VVILSEAKDLLSAVMAETADPSPRSG